MAFGKWSFRGIGQTCLDFRSRTFPAERIVWALFCLTSLQVAFLSPYVVLVPGERSNLFSALLCTVTLLAAVLFVGKGRVNWRSPEAIVSVVLTALVVVSCLFSSTPASSSARGFVLLASGLGGFWCARILLVSEPAQRLFRSFGLLILAGILTLSLLSYAVTGNVYAFVDSNPHPVATRILLLWFAPLSLLVGIGSNGAARVAGGLLLAVSYLVCYLSVLRAAVLTPVVMLILAGFFRVLRVKYLLALLVIGCGTAILFLNHLPPEKMGKEFEPAYYRIENYPFSWHVAVKHPLLGIGLRAPRDEFLEDYEIKYPYVTREKLADSVGRIRVSDNMFLTFMADLGFPFLLIYCGSLVVLLVRLLRGLQKPSGDSFFHPLVLLLPITAGLLHCMVYDALLHPQVCWFFHMLLGLIPIGSQE